MASRCRRSSAASTATRSTYSHVACRVDRGQGIAEITVSAPATPAPTDLAAIHAAGAGFWPLALARELDDLILHLRANEEEIGLWVFKTSGSADAVEAYDRLLSGFAADWLVREIRLYLKRTLKRLDVSSRSVFALIEPGSCFAGTLLELALATDRSYMLEGGREGDGRPPAALRLTEMNFGPYPMVNGLTRLESRFLGEPGPVGDLKRRIGEDLEASAAAEAGLVTFTPDDIDWDDEVRIAVEERAAFSPDALTGMESSLRFGGPETLESKIFARLSAWQNWIFQRPNAVGPEGRPQGLRQRGAQRIRPEESVMAGIDYVERIPNNVNLAENRRLQRALEDWQPKFLDWWRDMGPDGFQAKDAYLRTAISVDAAGLGQVRLHQDAGLPVGHLSRTRGAGPEDQLRRPHGRSRVAGGARRVPRRPAAAHRDPGGYRARVGRAAAPSRPHVPVALRPAQPLPDQRGGGTAPVGDGLSARRVLRARRPRGVGGAPAAPLGDADKPRILGAFNERTPDWLSYFMFCFFTDRDGKYQLASLAESGFDPLSRTCRFMLTEEAHHMFVGEAGIGRIVQRTCELMREHKTDDVRRHGGIDLATIQKYINFHCSVSLDLFGSEVSTNAANFYTMGLKGRFEEMKKSDDHRLKEATYSVAELVGDRIDMREEAALVSLNERLRDDYVVDCQRGVTRWNQVIKSHGIDVELRLPHRGFHRRIGVFADAKVSPDGRVISEAEWDARHGDWLPNDSDQAFIGSLMQSVTEPGRFATWIAPPARGVNGQPVDFEYVRLD